MRTEADHIRKIWALKPPGDPKKVAHIREALGVGETIARLLVQRGITSFDQAKEFFRPALEKLHDPFLMKNMEKASDRVIQAIETGEKILVYGDYDVDGTTAVALFYTFLQEQGAVARYYIPDRYSEGYGISVKGVEYAKAEGFRLIISLDCGIRAVDPILTARAAGIDVIVCDHHLPPEKLPPAFAILDPKQNDCAYPFDELSGCAVGFKLVQAIAMKKGIPFERLEPYLDLLAVSLTCDIVPLTGENRILTWHGMKRINEAPRKGLRALLNLGGKKKKANVSDVVFQIGPRINAAGRLESGRKAVELLVSGDEKIAKAAGDCINQHNENRKMLDKSITRQALAMIAEEDALVYAKSTVLFHPDWHKGVIGIVASRLIETYHRPTVLLTESNGLATGSARSVRGFDIHKAIGQCSDLLTRFGGHRHAAGLSMELKNVPAFQERFSSIVAATIDDEQLVIRIEADAEIHLDDIHPKFFRILEQLAPFGPENMRPVFISRGMCDNGFGRIVGEDHLKLNLIQAGCARTFPAIAFRQGRHFAEISRGKPFDIAYTIEPNEWNGKVTLQLNIKDIRMAGAV